MSSSRGENATAPVRDSLVVVTNGTWMVAVPTRLQDGSLKVDLNATGLSISNTIIASIGWRSMLLDFDSVGQGRLPENKTVFEYRDRNIDSSGGRLAFVSRNRAVDSRFFLFYQDLKTGNITQLTSEGVAKAPVWSSDGNYIIFYWGKSTDVFYKDGFSLVQIDVKTGKLEELAPASKQTRWSPDRNHPVLFLPETNMLFFEANYTADFGCDIYSLNTKTHVTSKVTEGIYPVLRRDPSALIYMNRGLFEFNLLNSAKRLLVKSEGIEKPLWPKLSPSAQYLAYVVNGDVHVMDLQSGKHLRLAGTRILAADQFGWLSAIKGPNDALARKKNDK